MNWEECMRKLSSSSSILRYYPGIGQKGLQGAKHRVKIAGSLQEFETDTSPVRSIRITSLKIPLGAYEYAVR
jgi:hypothetical protein